MVTTEKHGLERLVFFKYYFQSFQCIEEMHLYCPYGALHRPISASPYTFSLYSQSERLNMSLTFIKYIRLWNTNVDCIIKQLYW